MSCDMDATPERTAPWTVQELLEEARRLQSGRSPLFPWPTLFEIVTTGSLDRLRRLPDVERRYQQFNTLLRSSYGGVEKYLRSQLGWDSTAVHPPHWSRDDPVQLRTNDWAYSVPKDVTHYVVWVPSPLFHPVLCTPPPSLPPSPPGSPGGSEAPPLPLFPSAPGLPAKGSWEHVSRFGLYGSTGFGKGERCVVDEDRPEKEIEAFVKREWSEDEWETLWFANPPSLQSVRGLAHFHVLARRKESAE